MYNTARLPINSEINIVLGCKLRALRDKVQFMFPVITALPVRPYSVIHTGFHSSEVGVIRIVLDSTSGNRHERCIYPYSGLMGENQSSATPSPCRPMPSRGAQTRTHGTHLRLWPVTAQVIEAVLLVGPADDRTV